MNDELAESKEELKTVEPQLIVEPKSKVQEIFSQLEFMALHKEGKGGLDFSKLDKEQTDKVLDTLLLNEKNAFTYHTKRLESQTEIELKRIDASIVTEKTNRYSIIFALIGIVLITLLILIFKETFFIPWLSFITGIAGGFGLGKVNFNSSSSTKNTTNPQDEDA